MTFCFNEYTITDAKTEQQIDSIYGLLSGKYLDRKIIERVVELSICFGVFYENEQIGFARIISDFTTAYCLCDFIIHEQHTNKGLEEELLKAIIIVDDKFHALRGVAYTTDTHNVFRKCGLRMS